MIFFSFSALLLLSPENFSIYVIHELLRCFAALAILQTFGLGWFSLKIAPGITKKAPVLTKGRGRNLVVPPFFTVCSHKLPFKYTHPVKTIQSICEYSDKITAAAPLQSTFAKSQVRCRAQRGIPYKLPLRLSPAGCSLLVSLISTCSPQRWYTEYNNVIKKCQVIIFTP